MTTLVHYFKYDDIIIAPDRQRKRFTQEALDSLESSIQRLGLMHPPVFRIVEGDKPQLVAGERRVRAMMQLHEFDIMFLCNGQPVPLGFIPGLFLTQLSELEAREAELEENILRENLTWQELVQAKASLHEVRTAQNPGQTLTKTASEIKGIPAVGQEITDIRESLVIADHLLDPEVAKAKTQKDAMKLVKKKLEAQHRELLSTQFEAKTSNHDCLHGSCLDILPRLPDASFDIILTDPPYGVNANAFGDQAGTGHNYDDSPDLYNQLLSVLPDLYFQKARSQAHLYWFLDIRNFEKSAVEFSLAGWDVWPTPLIWNKGNGMLPRPDFGPRRTYEAILFASKGGKRVQAVYPDVITVSGVGNLKHGAQKPVDLYVNLLARSALPGDTVLDTFAGSGTIFPAANRCKLVATGIELIRENYTLCLSRQDEVSSEDILGGL